VDRLVKEYGVGYIKMDYNINAGSGTIVGADSFGDGLLQHNRAYLAWLDSLFARYPDLVIENCGSGGMRMDYALLERHSIQSVTDQTDYRKHAAIAAASPTAVTPEQAAVWSYPLANRDREEVIFNMVNAMLTRVLLSGQLAEMSAELHLLVKQGIDCYKSIRQYIKRSVPFWPLGRLPGIEDSWLCLGLTCAERTYLAVWRMGTDSEACRLPIALLQNRQVTVRCAYPLESNCEWGWEPESGVLNVVFPGKYTARVFEIF
jgi:alpha-galactosidase